VPAVAVALQDVLVGRATADRHSLATYAVVADAEDAPSSAAAATATATADMENFRFAHFPLGVARMR
jgi:hypothetical protein